ncbi:MAG: NUDIX domain-containing protein [Micromonosporaceae bacterium]|nr:NUDIX domain-containing protein [Micromonosporaceae bacterium]
MTGSSLMDRLASEAASDGVQQLVVGAIIAGDRSVPLLRRPAVDFMGGIYELPSGKVDPGEHLGQALSREVREETGLQVTSVGAYLGSFDYASGSGRKMRQFTFTVQVAAAEPIVLTEHDEYRWAPLDAEPPVTDAVKQVIARYRTSIVHGSEDPGRIPADDDPRRGPGNDQPTGRPWPD